MSASVHAMAAVNEIAVRQNSAQMLRLLGAKANRYDFAQSLFLAEVTIAIASVAAGLVAAINADFGPAAALFGIMGLIGVTWLEGERHTAVVEAAAVQEIFDNALFEFMPPRQFGGHLISPEAIASWAAAYSGKRYLRDWYAVELAALPLPIARIACQRANAEWDATMRQRFAKILSVVLAGASVSPFVLATLRNESARTLNICLFAITPFLYLCYKTIQLNRDVVRGRRRVQSRAQALWDDAIQGRRPVEELGFESSALQGEIYSLRMSSAPLFDWAYSLFRARQETCMRQTAQELVEEYERLERGQIRSTRSPYS